MQCSHCGQEDGTRTSQVPVRLAGGPPLARTSRESFEPRASLSQSSSSPQRQASSTTLADALRTPAAPQPHARSPSANFMSLSVSFSLLHSATAAVANDLRPAAVVAARLAMMAARGCIVEPLRQSLCNKVLMSTPPSLCLASLRLLMGRYSSSSSCPQAISQVAVRVRVRVRVTG